MQIHETCGNGARDALVCAPGAARADAVLDWNAIMVRTVAGQNPFAQGRTAAVAQLAVFEAVNAISGDYRPYPRRDRGAAGRLDRVSGRGRGARGAPSLRAGRGRGARGGAGILAGRHSGGTGQGQGAAGRRIGRRGRDGARADDGSLPPQFHVPGSTAPGEWQLTPGCPPAGGILLHWRQVRPFGIARSDQFRSAPPPPLGAAATPATTPRSGGQRRRRPRAPARPGRRGALLQRGAGRREWNPAVRQVAASRGTTIAENARTFALLDMAISDGLVS